MENKVTGSVSAERALTIMNALQVVQNELPFLIELSPAESKRIVRMEAGRSDFVRKALLLANNNTRLRPQIFELDEMQQDLDLCRALDVILATANKLVKQLSDTRDQAGYEAYSAALEVYNLSKRGAAKGMPGAQTAYEELKLMFEGQGKTAKSASENDLRQH